MEISYQINEELELNHQEVEALIERAFKNAPHSDHKEHELVARLRKSDAFIKELSLIAHDNGNVIGHILFTKMKVRDEVGEEVEALALAPLAVLPEYQKEGIGSQLIREGLGIARGLGHKIVIVLGHEDYYPRFGFKKAKEYGIKAPFPVPENAFMVLELVPESLKGVSGTAIYANAFNE